jgi:hypothetical protein
MAGVAVAADGARPAGLIARARQIRRAAGIALTQMCRQVGVSKGTLSTWERHPPPGLGTHPAAWGKDDLWLELLAELDDGGDG